MNGIIIAVKDEKYLPKKQTSWAFCYDVCSRENTTIKPWEVKLIKTGVKVALPLWVAMLIYPRSSLPIKKGLIMANSVGIIDSDYRWEIHLQLMNITDHEIEIKDGERYWQAMYQWSIEGEIKIEKSFDTFEEDYPTERGTGWFWSTGK